MPAFKPGMSSMSGAHVKRIDPAPSTAEAKAGAAHAEPRHAYTAADFRRELARVRRARKRRFILAIAAVLIVTVVVALVIAGFPPRRVADASMEPVLAEGQIVLVAGDDSFSSGAVIAFDDVDGNHRFGRVVAEPGSWVGISSDGTVAVSESELGREAMLSVFGTNSFGVVSRTVPDGWYYVLGDAEQATASGLQTEADFVDAGRISGRVAFSVWPITSIGPVS